MKRLESELKNLVELQQSMATNVGELYADTHARRAEQCREASTSFTSAALACTDSLQFFITYLSGKQKQFEDFDKRIDARDSALLYADAKSERWLCLYGGTIALTRTIAFINSKKRAMPNRRRSSAMLARKWTARARNTKRSTATC
jgi:hypothetical protein